MEHLRRFVAYFNDREDTLRIRANEDMFLHLEEVFLPHLLRVLQKDNTLIAEVELFPGKKVAHLWDKSEEAWQLLHMALLYSVLHGDPKEKFGKILETVKTMLPGGTGTDEITAVLEDSETQNSLKEFLELVMTTRIASLVGDIAQSISISDLDLNFEDTDKLMEMMRNPQDSPVLKDIAERAQAVLEERIRSGKINQQDLVREVETLRAKFQSSFGRYLNEMVTGSAGNTTGNTASQILSNSPEARRARMLARLQKKQREKTHR